MSVDALKLAQFALGCKVTLDTTEQAGFFYQAARTCKVAREYFLDATSGFKQITKGFGNVEMTLKHFNVTLSKPMAGVFAAFAGAKSLLTVSEVFSKLKGIFAPLPQKSIFEGAQNASTAQRTLAKFGEISDWTLSACGAYGFAGEMGFVPARKGVVEKVLTVAGAVNFVSGATKEIAKWYTGKVVDSQTGKEDPFTGAEKVKSLWTSLILVSAGALSALGFAKMLNYKTSPMVANGCLSAITAGAIGLHFWTKLVVE